MDLIDLCNDLRMYIYKNISSNNIFVMKLSYISFIKPNLKNYIYMYNTDK